MIDWNTVLSVLVAMGLYHLSALVLQVFEVALKILKNARGNKDE